MHEAYDSQNGLRKCRLACVYGTRPISPESTSSVPRLLAQLLIALSDVESGTEVVAVCPPSGKGEGLSFNELRLGRLDRMLLRLRPLSKGISHDALWSAKALKAMVREKATIDIILCATTFGAIYARRAFPKTKIIYWIHSLPVTKHENAAFQALNAADIVVVPSRAIYKALWNLYSRQSFPPAVWFIPNWVDETTFSPTSTEHRNNARRELGLAEDDFAIAHVGGAVPHKGRHIVEQALRLVHQHRQERLILLSAGGTRQTRHILTHGVELVELGSLPPQQLAALFHAADLGVVPSVWWENAPLALIEMLSCGLCVVAANAGGISEIMSHEATGLIVNLPNDVVGWATAIERVVEDEQLRARLGLGARATMQTSFPLARSLEAWRHLLKSVC